MTHKFLKLGLAGITLASAVTYLAVKGLQGGLQYDVGVDQYMAQADLHGKRARIAGTVSEENLKTEKDGLGAEFYVLGQSQKLRVAYKGTIPDQFKAGCALVVEGKQDSTGVFQADKMLTKCASKYEERVNEATMPSTKPSSTATEKGGNGASGTGVKR
jgi:cytochrome c-type biogenesis protein CcmE